MGESDRTHVASRAAGAILVSSIDTPLGAFLVASRGGRLVCSSGPRLDVSDALAWGRWRWPDLEILPAGVAHRRAKQQIVEYFAGARRAFDLPLEFHGSELHVRAWLTAIEIPYGTTRTYGDIAWEIGAPGAARAVGRAMTLCELPVLVPCHRVVGSGGRRCGSLEAWERRRQLLEFEREHANDSRKQRKAVDLRHSNRIAYRDIANPPDER